MTILKSDTNGRPIYVHMNRRRTVLESHASSLFVFVRNRSAHAQVSLVDLAPLLPVQHNSFSKCICIFFLLTCGYVEISIVSIDWFVMSEFDKLIYTFDNHFQLDFIRFINFAIPEVILLHKSQYRFVKMCNKIIKKKEILYLWLCVSHSQMRIRFFFKWRIKFDSSNC